MGGPSEPAGTWIASCRPLGRVRNITVPLVQRQPHVFAEEFKTAVLVVDERLQWAQIKGSEAGLTGFGRNAGDKWKKRCFCLAARRRRRNNEISSAQDEGDGEFLDLTQCGPALPADPTLHRPVEAIERALPLRAGS